MDTTPVANHSSSMSRRPNYEVFLSFRGTDVRRDFGDFLFTMLTDAGIRVFRDEEELERGEEIDPQLKDAIQQSKISIPIISEGYASSRSCLMELEEMVSMDNKSHIIIPIFYYVEPSDVHNCTGSIGRSMQGHKHNKDGKAIDSWKSALLQIGRLKGCHVRKTSEVSHGKLIKLIVHQVLKKLKEEDLIVTKHLVGVDPHVREIMAKLKVVYQSGQAVNIGPTCEKIRAEIKQHSVLPLQNKLISDLHKGNIVKFDSSDHALAHIRNRFLTMKILVLLDDVEDHEQLRAMVGDLDWLGPGSRVILTSQRRDVLRNVNSAESFALGLMKQDAALELFCRHAFGTDSPHKEFENLSTEIVAATGGLPLALQVVGSSLFLEKSETVWREALSELEVAPHERVKAALKRSYANLDKNERKIFLDIACLFIGMDMRIPRYMWSDCDYSPSISIQALHAWSLVEIGEDKELCMHEILKNFGREIVKNESEYQPWRRSRLFDPKEALHVIEGRKGTQNVEALTLKFSNGSKGNFTFECDQFDGLQNLRFLKLDRADIQGNFGDRLLNLRWLDWQGCPKVLDVQTLNLNLQNLVILDLSWSQVFKDWKGWKLLTEARKLKVLKLTGCVQLIATPNFPASSELERLILEGCSRLAAVNSSFGNLKKLVSLNMKQCSLLDELPDLGPLRGLKELVMDGTSIPRINFQDGSMMMLKILSARYCKKLNKISDSIKYLKSLTYLALDGAEIDSLPESIGSLEKLKTLSLKSCRSLSHLPDEIGKLLSLRFLDLSDTVIQKLPPSVKGWKDIRVLRMRGTFIREFPDAILYLEKLEEIDFSSCRSLKGKIPCDIRRLSYLAILRLSRTQISSLPSSFDRLSQLQELDIFGCDNLQSLPKLPSSLITVRQNFNQ